MSQFTVKVVERHGKLTKSGSKIDEKRLKTIPTTTPCVFFTFSDTGSIFSTSAQDAID